MDSIGAVVRPNAVFGQGTDPIYFHSLKCSGLENRLFDCPYLGGMEPTNCQHSQDAGLTCIAGIEAHAHSYV